MNELATLVMEAMGMEGEVKHLEARNEVAFAFSDHSKVARVYGKQAETSLGDGLRRMAPWAKATGARESAAFGNIEIQRNLPPSWLHS